MADFQIKDRYDFNDFVALVKVLRDPGGCPWDAEQTHESIRRNAIEEAYELAHAIDTGDKENLREELGDMMMQVLFHSYMEEEKGGFDLNDVCDAACKKLIFRHPHVFGDKSGDSAEEALRSWEEYKRKEKGQKTVGESLAAVAESLPALWRAEKIQKKCAAAGFDWPDTDMALSKVEEETGELREALASGDGDRIEEELGDLLFAAVCAGRMGGADPEKALHRSCEKMIGRFDRLERIVSEKGESLSQMPFERLSELYRQAKMRN